MQFQPAYLIIGVVITVVAIIFKMFPPKKINMWHGYRSETSMESQEAWEAAQKYSSKLMLIEGIILIIFGVIFGVMSAQMENKIKNIILISFLAIVIPVMFIWLLVATEVYLNKNFGEKKEDGRTL
jgi:uncharacterized membrane protein